MNILLLLHSLQTTFSIETTDKLQSFVSMIWPTFHFYSFNAFKFADKYLKGEFTTTDAEQQIAVSGKDKISLEESVHGSCFHNKDNMTSFCPQFLQ